MNTHKSQIDAPDVPFFDVIIVGGGIVGATAALCLAKMHSKSTLQRQTNDQDQQQLKIALIEANEQNQHFEGGEFDPRVVALSLESQQLLMDIGVWPSIVAKRICPYVGMQVWDGEGTGHVEFHSHDIHQDSLGAIVENSVIVNSLSHHIEQTPSIYTMRGVKVTNIQLIKKGTHAQITQLTTDEGQQLHCSLLIAADGSQSTLRQLAGIDTREWQYGHTAIVTTIRTEHSHQFHAWQRFTQYGPLAFLPLTKDGSDSNRVSIVWSLASDQAEHVMKLDDTEFCTQLSQAFEKRLGDVFATEKRFAFPLVQRHATDYFKPGITLIGDAAHAIHPLAGQGVNLGLYDVKILSHEICRAYQRKVPLNHTSILRRYQRQRMPHNLAAMAAMEAFKRLFGADNLTTRWLRNQGMHFVNKQTALKKILSSVAMGKAS